MKKYLLFLLAFLMLSSCGSQARRKKNPSLGLKGFFTYYNTLFNSKDALETEINSRKKNHKDNFYNDYIRLLTTDEELMGFDLESKNALFSDQSQSNANTESKSDKATILQISEAKALKAITKYSIIKQGVEKNKRLFDAHILLARSRLLMNKPLEALDALNYIFTYMDKDKDIVLATIYQAQAYTKLGDYVKAKQLFEDAKKSSKLKNSQAKLLSVYYAQMLLDSGDKKAAEEELQTAFSLNKNRVLRSRIAYLRGQILNHLGKQEEARESFVTAYKYANDFDFEVKAQIEIAKTYNGNKEDYEGAKKYIESISKKGIYASRKNEFYYALGLMAKKAGKEEEALNFFRQSLTEKTSDPQIRGLAFYEIGQNFFSKNDYIATGAYYDSALAVMTYQPEKKRLEEIAANIKKVTTNYYLIKKNDSILALTKMSPPEKEVYFSKYIENLKEKEHKEEVERIREERTKGFDTGDYDANSIFASNSPTFTDFSSSARKGKNTFYFNNATTVQKGIQDFKKIWGNRQLGDNWRYSTIKTSINEVREQAMGLQSQKDPRRFEPAFYIEKIPTEESIITSLKKDRDTASLGLGIMYQTFFSRTKLATKTLYNLVDNHPEEEVEIKALYQIFSMNYEHNPSDAERAKQLILEKYPYTSYAEFVRNPKSSTFVTSSDEVLELYKKAFELYSEEKFSESMGVIARALEAYPKDALVPKFALLNAFNTGKTAGKEVMLLQLQQIALTYPTTQEGSKAQEMMKYLTSELNITNEGSSQPVAKEEVKEQENTVRSKKVEFNTQPNSPNIQDRYKSPTKDLQKNNSQTNEGPPKLEDLMKNKWGR